MSFPYHDHFWRDTASFVEERARCTDAILAPDIFWWRFPKIYRYSNTRLRPNQDYDWVILHKGLLHELPKSFVVGALAALKRVFANEVFVILHRGDELKQLESNNEHLRAVTERLNDLVDEPILPDPGAIVQFSSLNDDQLAEAMDQFWRNGGYVYSTLRDKAYYQEIDRCISDFIGNGAGRNILDVACGIGRCQCLFLRRATMATATASLAKQVQELRKLIEARSLKSGQPVYLKAGSEVPADIDPSRVIFIERVMVDPAPQPDEQLPEIVEASPAIERSSPSFSRKLAEPELGIV